MNTAIRLRKRLLTQLFFPSSSREARLSFGLLFKGRANKAPIVNPQITQGDFTFPWFKGYAVLRKTYYASGLINILVRIAGHMKIAELPLRTQSQEQFRYDVNGDAKIATSMPIQNEESFGFTTQGAMNYGDALATASAENISGVELSGYMEFAVSYTVEENIYGGLTYDITGSYYTIDGNSVIIGGSE